MLVNLLTPYSGKEYPIALTEKVGNKAIKYVPFNVTKDLDDVYTWEYILLEQDYYDYKGLVNALIGIKYDLADMLAVINNYMDDPKNDIYKKEFKDMQDWRKKSKQMAKEHFNVD